MQFYDGGAFADCPYIQYPNGMGRQRAPATVLNAAAAAAASSSSASATANRSHGVTVTASLTSVRLPPVSTTATAASSPSSSSAATRGASARFNDSHALALVPTSSPSASTSVVLATSAAAQPHKAVVETAEERTARTARHLQDTLHAARQTTEVFDGRSLALQSRQRAAANTPNAASNALTIVVSGSDGVPGARESDPGPIVRSPTKDKKNKFTDALLLRSTAGGKTKTDGADGPGEAGQSVAAASSTAMVMAVTAEAQQGSSSSGGAAASRKVVVPFSVSNWQNRKKIIVPVEQRLAQQHDDRLDSASDMGDAIMDLAVAMQKASKEVAAEMAAKERAKAEEEERQQAALEAAEAARAKQLLEQKAAELAANAQRRETREQRLERIKLERELREQEKLAKQEQRMRERAAARLNISVEDLEADEQLLHAVEEASVHAGTLPSAAAAGPVKQEHGSLSGLAAAPLPASASSPSPISRHGLGGGEGEDDEDGDGTVGGRRKPAVRGGVFASAVISNEGIQREMEALAALGAAGTAHDGIRMREEGPSDSDDDKDGEDADGGAFQLHKFVKKKKRL